MEHNIYKERFKSVETREAGLKKSTEEGSQFALYIESIESETLASSRCDITIIPMSQPYPLGWIYRKNFEHRGAFDYM